MIFAAVIDAERFAMDDDRLEQHVKRAQEAIASDKKEVPPFWIKKYKNEAAKNWDRFYMRNTTKFFKGGRLISISKIKTYQVLDRHWTDREFEELVPKEGQQVSMKKKMAGILLFTVWQVRCLEVGCGVGNFVFPALADNANLFIYACDFSKRAVDMVKVRSYW